MKYVRGFYFFPYDTRDTINIGLYPEDSSEPGTEGEFSVTWVGFSHVIIDKKPRAQLRVFQDTWKMFAEFQDLISEMARVGGEKIQVEEFRELLLRLGYKDFTR